MKKKSDDNYSRSFPPKKLQKLLVTAHYSHFELLRFGVFEQKMSIKSAERLTASAQTIKNTLV